MRGYIVDITYEIIAEKPYIRIYGRLENGESFTASTAFKPYFFARKRDIEKAGIKNLDSVETKLTDFDGRRVIRVNTKVPSDVPEARKALEEAEVKTYEADIRFVQRYYIDMDIMGTIEIDGEYEKGEFVDRVYSNSEILSTAPYDVKLKTIAIDIETDKDVKQVYSISIYGSGVSEVHIVTPGKVDAIAYGSELELLQGFIKRVREIDPDIITGWNLIDFDLNVLTKRMQHYNIPFAIGRNERGVRMRIIQDFFRESSANIPGRIAFDGISLMKQAFIGFDDYKLNTVAAEVLGEEKVELEPDFWDRFVDIVKDEPQRVVEYNLKDSKLVIEILKKKKLIDLFIKKSLITGMQLDRVKGSVASLDSLYIRAAHNIGYVCPNSSFADREERMKGAYVMKPKPGIYDYVAVLDFKSLYPSIIRTYNIDPIAHTKDGEIVAPNGARFRNDEGILPQIISSLWKERDQAKKENDDVKSYAIKIIMNSFYGVLANPSCRFYSLDMGNAITSFARETIKETANLLEEKGYTVLYGDTDSVFVDLKVNNYDDAKKSGDSLAEYINNYFKMRVQQKYNRKSLLELEFEKVFKVLMLPMMRGSSGGAKKRYAGLLIKDGKEEMSVTGMEIVRRDWTEMAKEVQKEMLDRVFHKKEVAEYIKKVVEDIKDGKNDEKLIYRKSIRKDLSEYTKTTPPHVKAARMLPKLRSNIIEYYMTVNGPEPVEITKSSIDYDHYIEKQIKPIAETILALFGQNFDDVISGTNQKSLFDY